MLLESGRNCHNLISLGLNPAQFAIPRIHRNLADRLARQRQQQYVISGHSEKAIAEEFEFQAAQFELNPSFGSNYGSVWSRIAFDGFAVIIWGEEFFQALERHEFSSTLLVHGDGCV